MDNKFKEILEKLDPTGKVITESIKTELVTLMESKEKTIKEQAYEKALTVVNEKIKALDEDHSGKLQTIVEKLKEKNRKSLEAQDADHARKLNEIVKRLDHDHTVKVRRLVEAIDEDHSNKLKTVVESIDADHSKKLSRIVEHFKTPVADKKLVDGISDYLDVYLEKTLPKKKLVNEARLNKLEKFYRSIREMAMVNDKFVQTEIREAIEDASGQLSRKDAEIDRLMMEKAELTNRMKSIEARNLLSEKCQNLPPSLAAFLQTRFEGSTKEEIEGKFNEAVEAFKKEEKIKRNKIVENSADKAKVKNPVTITEGTDLSTKKEEIPFATDMAGYVNVLKKSNKR